MTTSETYWRHVGGGNIADSSGKQIGRFIGDFRHRDRLILAVNGERAKDARIAELGEQLAALSQQAAQEPKLAGYFAFNKDWNIWEQVNESCKDDDDVAALYATAPAKPAEQEKAMKQRAKGWHQCPSCDRLHAQLSEDSAFVQAHRHAEAEQQAPAITEQAPPLPEPKYPAIMAGLWPNPKQAGYTADQLRERDAMWMAKIAALRSEQAQGGAQNAQNQPESRTSAESRVVPQQAPAGEAPSMPGSLKELIRGYRRCARQDLKECMGMIEREYSAALSTPPAVPPDWRKFVEDCSKTAGGMVNGNQLSTLAFRLLSAAPAAPQGEQPK